MIPMRIEVTDFLSYGRAALDLDGLGLVALAGGNGAGKSALAVDAPTWGLWGESRGTRERLTAILGLDGQPFINTACLVQGRADEFARASPKDRKAVLAEILGLRAWPGWGGEG